MIKDFPYKSLEHYLNVHGLHDLGDAALLEAKKRYRALYQKYYRRQAKTKQVNVLIEESDFKHLERQANKYGLKKATQFLLHLVRNDREGKDGTPPNLMLDIEVGILKSIDGLSKLMNAKPETRSKVILVVQQLEELLILLAS